MAQTIYTGKNICDKLPEIIEKAGITKLMLVCGRSFDKQPIARTVLNMDIPIVRFSGFGPNPLYDDVCVGIKQFNDEKCDGILAIGGGSAIDTAKCIKLFFKMDPSIVYMEQEYKDTGIPLIAVPTTAGTGSESTRHAVCYYEGKKQSISHMSIVPDYVLLKPLLLKNLPLYQKKCTMLDALCQACESWWNINRTEESIRYSREAISLIAENADRYLIDNDEDAAEKILIAANLAGQAINITATTAAHAMSYKITSMYGQPHGHAVAVCFAEVWREMWEELSSGKIEDEKLKVIFKDIAKQMGYENVDDAITGFSQTLEKYELLNPVSENYEEDITILSESVNPVRLKNNPIQFEKDTIQKMYRNIVQNS